jgi:hypothetical protein
MKYLETNLRSVIKNKLQLITSNWWLEKIPEDVRKNAEERKRKNAKIWSVSDQKDLHPIFYVDFSDYIKIIKRKDNWNQVFSLIFSDSELISAKLKELEPVRNAIAHNRELTKREKTLLNLHASDIISCINKSK